jgi:hypothetical protein
VESYDLELGPLKRTFDSLFKLINQYFHSAPVEPIGKIKEIDLQTYSQRQLRETLNSCLEHYGFTDLPAALRIVVSSSSRISGIHRSDNISTYDERMKDGSHRTYNFYSKDGPDSMKVSYYWLDMASGGEQTQGILTEGNIWYLRITTAEGKVYYHRIERDPL